MNPQPQIPDLFSANYTLERKIRAWENVSSEKQKNQLTKILVYLFFNPLSTSREISTGINVDRTSVCGRLGDPKYKKYFDESKEKICSVSHELVTAYKISPDGEKYLEGKTNG